MNIYPHEVGDFHYGIKIHELPMVYVLASDDFNFIKIGHTKSFKNRFRNIQNGCPYKLFLWYSIFTPRCVEIERHLHSTYSHCRVRGEWFSPSDDDIDQLSRFFSLTNAHIKGIVRGIPKC